MLCERLAGKAVRVNESNCMPWVNIVSLAAAPVLCHTSVGLNEEVQRRRPERVRTMTEQVEGWLTLSGGLKTF